jgi:hypothetical protein
MVPFANKQALKRKIPKYYDKQQQLELVLVALGAYLDALGMPRKRHKHLQSFNPQNFTENSLSKGLQSSLPNPT